MRPRYLVKWEELSDITDHCLNLDQNEGWEVNEMFDTNAINFGYKSTFDKTMPEYTTILEREHKTEYKIRWERACRLADEIEAKKRADQAFQASQPKKRKRKPRRSIKREENPY
ncbi:ataxin-2-like protein [Apostichopus japonicus]|uniref:ataxin-2-like protein n=1 Tax=Stichopus japonicus TaxID=307972 RepID=UPI003AB2DD05